MIKKFCPNCKSQLEVLNACGARDFFCPKCNQLISKKKVLESPESSAIVDQLDKKETEQN